MGHVDVIAGLELVCVSVRLVLHVCLGLSVSFFCVSLSVSASLSHLYLCACVDALPYRSNEVVSSPFRFF